MLKITTLLLLRNRQDLGSNLLQAVLPLKILFFPYYKTSKNFYVVFERKTNGYHEKNRMSNGESNVWCQTTGQANTEDMMDMLGLNHTIGKMAKASGVRW